MKIYLQGINISYLWKKKFIFKSAFLGCVTVVPRRVYFPSLFAHCHLLPAASVLLMTGLSIVDDEVPPDRRDLGPLCIVMMPKPKDQVRSQELSLCHVTKGSFNHNQSTNQSINQSINQPTSRSLSLFIYIYMQIYYTYVHENLRKTQASALRIRWFLPQFTHVAPAMPITTSTHQRIGFGSANLTLFLQQASESYHVYWFYFSIIFLLTLLAQHLECSIARASFLPCSISHFSRNELQTSDSPRNSQQPAAYKKIESLDTHQITYTQNQSVSASLSWTSSFG